MVASARKKIVRTKKKARPAHKTNKLIGSRKHKRTVIDSQPAHQAVSLVKLVGITMRLKELNNHLQGLYAELGRIVYEQQRHRSARISRMHKAGMERLMDSIMEMRKKMDRLEREARSLKKAA